MTAFTAAVPAIMAGEWPNGCNILAVSSGVVVNANAVATLPGAAGVTTYLSGFYVSAGGATTATLVGLVVQGLFGGQTVEFAVAVPGSPQAQCQPVFMEFVRSLPAIAPNSAIVVTLPALGAGNLGACVNAWGYQL